MTETLSPDAAVLEAEIKKHRQRKLLRFIESQGGQIPFDVFMHHSLYGRGENKGEGFYHSIVIGSKDEQGAFQTHASNPLYAELIVKYVRPHLEAGERFVELAGGMGSFKRNFLHTCEENNLPCRYMSIDISDSLSQAQHALGGETIQASSLQLPFPDNSIEGVFFMNELVDALPFKVVQPIVENHQLLGFKELVMKATDDAVETLWQPINTPEFQRYWQRQLSFLSRYMGFDPNEDLKTGMVMCVNFHEETLLREIHRVLKRGSIIVADYGGDVTELNGDKKFDLRAYPPEKRVHLYHTHQLAYDADLTTDVNFTNLALVAEQLGLQVRSLSKSTETGKKCQLLGHGPR